MSTEAKRGEICSKEELYMVKYLGRYTGWFWEFSDTGGFGVLQKINFMRGTKLEATF